MIEFIIESEAVPKARPRQGRNGFYTPSKTIRFEKLVAWYYLKNHGTKHEDEPLKMEIEINVKKPKSCKRKLPTVKPDIDNQIKSILDGLNGLAYSDDKQIVEVKASKKYSDRDFVKVKLEKIEEE